MIYEHIMRVGMTINDKKLGYLIVGGIDSSIDDLKVPYLVDKYIMVKTNTGDLKFKVKKMDLSTSISGNINLGIIIYDSDDFFKIKAGDEVFALLD